MDGLKNAFIGILIGVIFFLVFQGNDQPAPWNKTSNKAATPAAAQPGATASVPAEGPGEEEPVAGSGYEAPKPKTEEEKLADLTSHLVPPAPLQMFTFDELAQHHCNNTDEIWLAILGQVFDVTKGKQHYGTDGGYKFFSGTDGSRAFVTGAFNDTGLTADIESLDVGETMGVFEWTEFYHKDYTYKGLLIGHYFDEKGVPSEAYHKVMAKVTLAKKAKHEEEDLKQIMPPCNSKWSQAEGGEVWCGRNSGGISRDWVGVPRQFWEVGMYTNTRTFLFL